MPHAELIAYSALLQSPYSAFYKVARKRYPTVFIQILSKIGVLFIVLFIGGIARRKGVLTEESTKALAQLVLIVTLPILYFYSLATRLTFGVFKVVWTLPLFAVCMVIFAYAIAKFSSRFVPLNLSQKATFIYLATFTNCGFLAIPIAYTLYGSGGVVRVVFFNIGFNLLYWTLGVWMLKGSRGNFTKRPSEKPWKELLNSGTIGLLCGTVAGLTALSLPLFVLESSQLVGSATIPLALLVVGSIMFAGENQKLSKYREVLVLIVGIRLILIPAIALFITAFFGSLSPLTRAIIVLQSAMPSASTTPIFTSRYGRDSHLASAGVFVTTAFSIITVPIFISLL